MSKFRGHESTAGEDFYWDWRRSADKESNRAALAGILNLEVGDEVAFHIVEGELAVRCDIDEVRANVDGGNEGKLVTLVLLVARVFLRTVLVVVVLVLELELLVHHLLHLVLELVHRVVLVCHGSNF